MRSTAIAAISKTQAVDRAASTTGRPPMGLTMLIRTPQPKENIAADKRTVEAILPPSSTGTECDVSRARQPSEQAPSRQAHDVRAAPNIRSTRLVLPRRNRS